VLAMMSEDIHRFPIQGLGTAHNLLTDARAMPLDTRSVDIVITSPPYLNGTNYIRNTKLELWILDYLRCEEQMSELHGSLLTAGINTVRASQETKNKSSFASVEEIVRSLGPVAYDRRIPLMVVGYFEDMFTVFTELWRVLKPGGKATIVVGDSAFSGIHVPTDRLLSEIGQTAGLRLDETCVVRTRRSRGGMELHESILTYTKE